MPDDRDPLTALAEDLADIRAAAAARAETAAATRPIELITRTGT